MHDFRAMAVIALTLVVLGAAPVVALACDVGPTGVNTELHQCCPHRSEIPSGKDRPTHGAQCLFQLCTCIHLFSPSTSQIVVASATSGIPICWNPPNMPRFGICFVIDHPPRVIC